MLVLAAGYLYAAVMTVPHVLAFPGVFTPTGLMGGGPQASAWLFVFWRIGYELSLIAYIVMSSRKPASPVRSASVAIVSSIVIVVALTCLLTLFATQADGILPALQNDGRYTRTTLVTAIVSLSLGLLFLLWFWRRGAKSVLDLWLLVVIFMILLSAVLSAVLNTGRFDFGFVFGRLFGLAAASFVLINLLIQNSRLYAKLAAGQAELQRLTRVDPLTGIANRRAFDLAIETEWRRAMRNRTACHCCWSTLTASRASTTFMVIRRATTVCVQSPMYWSIPREGPAKPLLVAAVKSSRCCFPALIAARPRCWHGGCARQCAISTFRTRHRRSQRM